MSVNKVRQPVLEKRLNQAQNVLISFSLWHLCVSSGGECRLVSRSSDTESYEIGCRH